MLTWTDPNDPEPAWLSNGLSGYRIQRSGEATAGFAAHLYQRGGEEKLIASPMESGPRDFGPTITGYRQTLNMRTGELTTEWVSANGKAYREISIVDNDGLLCTKIGPAGWVRSGVSTAKPPLSRDIAEQMRDAADTNRMLWNTDIEIDGPVEDQQAVRSFLFYLRMAVHPKGKMSVAPYALSSETYNGHVFWDADIWVFPALCLLDPDRAKTICEYRLARLDAARMNAKAWFSANPPKNEWQRRSPTDANFKPYAEIKDPPLMFPWESGFTGREVAPGESRKEHHITGSVMWSLDTARTLGLVDPGKVEEAGRGAAKFWLDRIQDGAQKKPGQFGNWGPFEVKDVMSPDEFHIGDNDLYTNLLANWTLDRFNPKNQLPVKGPAIFGRETRAKGGGGGPSLHLPDDKTSLLTYDDDAVRGYKQAAAVLAIYPLQFEWAETQARTMMERFESKVTPNGPAMSDSVHATIWARLGEAERAYETWHRSWKPFTDHPLMLFSEKRGKASTYFVTGAAGSLQTVLYGFLGFRIDYRVEPGAAWSKKLNGGYWLSIKPRLPKAWNKVVLKNFHVLGKRYTLIATPKSVTVTEGES